MFCKFISLTWWSTTANPACALLYCGRSHEKRIMGKYCQYQLQIQHFSFYVTLHLRFLWLKVFNQKVIWGLNALWQFFWCMKLSQLLQEQEHTRTLKCAKSHLISQCELYLTAKVLKGRTRTNRKTNTNKTCKTILYFTGLGCTYSFPILDGKGSRSGYS